MTLTHLAAPAGARVLDHIAIRVEDRDACAAELTDRLDVHVIDRTEKFTLIGPSFTAGKITLFDAEPGTTPEPQRIVSLVLATGPGGAAEAPIILGCGLVITFNANSGDESDPDDSVPADTPRHSLVGVVLRSMDPPIAAARLEADFGMRTDSISGDAASLSFAGEHSGGVVTLVRERMEAQSANGVPMLDHIGVRVDDARAWHAHAEQTSLHIDRWVEAPRTNAVFIAGPESVLIEYVEHLVHDVDA